MLRKFNLVIILLLVSLGATAQFSGLMGGGGSSSNYGNNSSPTDTSSQPSFSFKQYFNGLAHKDTIKITWMFGGSLVLPGTAQIYNKEYWKLPILYCGLGGMAYGGLHYNSLYKASGSDRDLLYRNLFIAGAAAIHWAFIVDGVSGYQSDISHQPGKAALYSALLPGMGQAYNGDYWKIPIFYGGLIFCGYLLDYNKKQYTRYRDLYNLSTTPNGGYDGPHTSETLKHYRDTFRRFKDYSTIATVLVYVLQIIDADVFATMSDFEVSDDLTFNLAPAVIQPVTPPLSINFASIQNSSIGVQLNLTF